MKRNKSFNNEPLLYLVATPIGNLGEFSKRAQEVIASSDFVAAEDTRVTGSLLAKFNINKPLISLREHNEKQMSEYVINKIKEGSKVVYVSDAGYPGISDPGYILAKECIAHDINVSVVNGSSAFLTALVASGLDTSHFYFYGFLPVKNGEASKELNKLKGLQDTLIFYEAPHRINATLKILLQELGDRDAVIGRELTKLNEEYIRGKLSELVEIDPNTLKGEMVIIVKGNEVVIDEDEEKINKAIKLLKEKGLSNRDVVEIISKLFDINKNKISKILY